MDGILPNLTYTIDTVLENSKFESLKPEERQEIRDFMMQVYYDNLITVMVNSIPEDKIADFQEILNEKGNIMDFMMVNVNNFDELFQDCTSRFINELISYCIFNEEYTYE